MKKIFILVAIASFFLTIKVLPALPVYKNYNNTDIFTIKFKSGYYNGRSKVTDYSFTSNEKGLDFSLEFNPLYNVKILHNIYVELNTGLSVGGNLKNNNLLFMLNYNLPLNISLPDWFPFVSVFVGGGYGMRQTKITGSSNFVAAKLNNSSNIVALNFGLEVIPKQLKDYNLGIYLSVKSLVSNYSTLDYGEKKNRRYVNNFVTIGLMYKINYLIK